MQSGRRRALLSLLNIITEDLQIEELKSITEAKILIPILIKFNKSGDLQFTAKEVDFHDAVEFIKEEMGECFVECLHPDLADRGDQHAMECFLLALIYVIRIKHDEKFLGLCKRLEDHDNEQIAWMIEKLDSFGHFSIIPFHELLPSLNDKENTNPAVLCTPLRTISEANISRSWKTPLSCERRRPCITTFDESPVNKVLGSPRGEDVSRIYALRQEVKRLKEFAASLGREKDHLDDLCISQSKEINKLTAQNSKLQDRVSFLKSQSERVIPLEDKVMLLEYENAQFSKNLIAEKNKNAKNEATISEIMFQRDEALQKVDLLVDQLEHLHNEYEKALKRGNDELLMHEQSRKRLLASEQKWSTEFFALEAKLSEAYTALEKEREMKSGKAELKEYEKDDHTFFLNQCLEKTEDDKRKLQLDLVGKDEEISRLNELIEKRGKIIADLTPYMSECMKLKREVGEYKLDSKIQSARLFNKNTQDFFFNNDKLNKIESLNREPVFLFGKPINSANVDGKSQSKGIFVDI
ncbi:hypothetical protein ACQ4LE_008295 [Meloidogyne hapla]|uniref:HOOK N-terminal domain-containing protein n=1 Tax=Meloidogyne hapla TaxID=6305 RepID=A0A1I8B338_MELHA